MQCAFSYSSMNTFCSVYICHEEYSKSLSMITISNFSSRMNTLSLHLSTLTSVCMELANSGMSVQHLSPEQEADKAHDV